MKKSHFVTGLDIGTDTIKIIVAEKKGPNGDLEVIFQTKEPSFGVRKGVIIDTEKVSQIIQLVFAKIKEETGKVIDSVFINAGGSHIFSAFSQGAVAVSRADQKISEEDMERVLQTAQSFSLSFNQEILAVFPKEFTVDQNRGLKEVIGMQGVKLGAEIVAVGGFSPYIKNLTQSVLDSDLQILDVVPCPLASALAVLTQKQKELGVALLDIGAGTSELAVFEEGNLIHLAVFPIGSANITNDIAIGLKTDVETAEFIKIQYGSCVCAGSNKREKIEAGEEVLVFFPKMLTGIIKARVSQIFAEVAKELKKISKNGLLPAGIVLTGGGANLNKIVELAKKDLKLSCRIGKPQGFVGLENDPSYAAACGLVLKAIDTEECDNKNSAVSKIGKTLGSKIKRMFQIFIP